MLLEQISKSIRNKYFIFLILFGLLPIVILGIISNRISSRILETELNRSTYQTLEKASVNIGTLLQRMSDLSDFLSRSGEITEVLANRKLQPGADPEDGRKQVNQVLKEVATFFNFPTHIFIIDSGGSVYSNISITAKEQAGIAARLKDNPDYMLPPGQENAIYWLGLRDNLLEGYDSGSMYYLGRNIVQLGEYQGTIYIGTGDYILFRTFNNIQVNEKSRIFVFDRNSGITAILPENVYDAGLKSRFPPVVSANKDEPQYMDISGVRNSVTFYKTQFNWDIAMATPVQSIRVKLATINSFTVTITIISVFSIALFLFLINTSFVKPIIYLSNLMKIARKGNLDIRSKLKNTDEIGILSDGFNKLLEDFKKMLEKIQEEELRKKDLEFRMLQSQIKPHFLYNTLNSIRWMAEMNHETKVGDSIVSLVRMLEYNTRNNERLVTVGDEIRYITEYLDLQRLRYWNRFEVRIGVAEDILACRIPKLTLQPIVENCLLHGLDTAKGKLLIAVEGNRTEGIVSLTVSDNGKGIGQETLQELTLRLKEHNETSAAGIGLSNVNQRIWLEYGADFGISISSIPSRGTEVCIKIPAESERCLK